MQIVFCDKEDTLMYSEEYDSNKEYSYSKYGGAVTDIYRQTMALEEHGIVTGHYEVMIAKCNEIYPGLNWGNSDNWEIDQYDQSGSYTGGYGYTCKDASRPEKE